MGDYWSELFFIIFPWSVVIKYEKVLAVNINTAIFFAIWSAFRVSKVGLWLLLIGNCCGDIAMIIITSQKKT